MKTFKLRSVDSHFSTHHGDIPPERRMAHTTICREQDLRDHKVIGVR